MPGINNRDLRKATLKTIPYFPRPFLTYSSKIQLKSLDLIFTTGYITLPLKYTDQSLYILLDRK